MHFKLFVLVVGVLRLLEAAETITLECDYRLNIAYTCEIRNAKIARKSEVINFSGTHLKDKLDVKVNIISLQGVIRYMPEQMFNQFRNLEVVYLDLVGFQKITNFDFDNATNLKYFYARGNNIRELDGFIFKNAVNLKHLMLSSNYIKYVNESTFAGLHVLDNLDLSQNYIKNLDASLFADLGNLNILTLVHNQIESLEKDLFKNNLKLKLINLNSNKIARIDLNLFDRLKKSLKTPMKISLDDNACIQEAIYLETITLSYLHHKLSNCQEIEEITIEPTNYCEDFDSREYNISGLEGCVQEVYGNLTVLKTELDELKFSHEILNEKYFNVTHSLHTAEREAQNCRHDWIYLILSHVGVFMLGMLITSVFCYFLIRYMREEESDNEGERTNKGMRYY